MIEIKDKKNCTGCGACYNVCPVNAIKMIEDKEGFKYPVVDKEKCINCGLCKRTCPIINKVWKKDNYERPSVIASWSKQNDVRLDSTSGGVFSELANYIYKKRGYVCGAIYNNEWLVEHYISSSKKDIEKLRSSKYLQSDINTVFRELKKLLQKGEYVLICGSPCQIAGFYSFLGKKDYDNLYTCDFICRGMNSPKIFKGYITELEKKYRSKVKNIKFKNKINGWHNFSTKVDFENGKTYIGGRYTDSYMVGYLKYNAFMRPACYDCKFKKMPRNADITLADFWGIENIDSKLDNDCGTSMVLLNSKKGEDLFNNVKDNLEYFEIVSDKVFEENVCMNDSVLMTEERKKVFDNIDRLSYKELSNTFFPEPKAIEKLKIKIRTDKKIKKVKKGIKIFFKKCFRRK